MVRLYADEPLEDSIGAPWEREAKLNDHIRELQLQVDAARNWVLDCYPAEHDSFMKAIERRES